MKAAMWSVRRFAAIDMPGTAGTQRRRRVVTVEFVLGTAGLILIGALKLIHWGGLWAAWLLGCGANYCALAVHAVHAAALYQPGRLEAESDGVDLRCELRRYSIAQLRLFIPTLLAVVALAQAFRRDGGRLVPGGAVTIG